MIKPSGEYSPCWTCCRHPFADDCCALCGQAGKSFRGGAECHVQRIRTAPGPFCLLVIPPLPHGGALGAFAGRAGSPKPLAVERRKPWSHGGTGRAARRLFGSWRMLCFRGAAGAPSRGSAGERGCRRCRIALTRTLTDRPGLAFDGVGIEQASVQFAPALTANVTIGAHGQPPAGSNTVPCWSDNTGRRRSPAWSIHQRHSIGSDQRTGGVIGPARTRSASCFILRRISPAGY